MTLTGFNEAAAPSRAFAIFRRSWLTILLLATLAFAVATAAAEPGGKQEGCVGPIVGERGNVPNRVRDQVEDVSIGVFYDAPVQGLRYSTPSQTGCTNSRGEFQFIPGETVTFSVGSLVLGSTVVTADTGRVTPAHLVPDVAGDVKKISDSRVTNIARLLQSIGKDGEFENGIVISARTERAVSEHAAGIDFSASEATFAQQPAVTALFAELGATLRTGPQARNHLRQTLLGIRQLSNVHIPTRDGSYMLADVFLPIDEGQYPVVFTPTAYGKAFGGGCACDEQAELAKAAAEDTYFAGSGSSLYEVLVAPNSVQWVPKGFVIIRMDTRGTCNNPGTLYPYSAQEAFDNYDAIEWVARQPWSNGNIGMWGLSYSASTQFNVASLKPPHLKALISDSHDPDQYRDIVFQGGIYYRDYRESWFYNNVAGKALRCQNQNYVDIVNIFKANRFADPRVYGPIGIDPATGSQLPLGQVSADLSQISIPVWSIERQDIWPIHVRGPGETFRSLASNDKRLTIEVGDELTKAYLPETVSLHQAFFNMHLAGKQVGDTELPQQPVTVEYRLPGGQFVTGYENEWPIPRTQYVKYYLNASNPAGGTMSLTPPTPEAATTYSADVHAELPSARLACSQYGVSFVSEPMAQDTTIAGYMKMGLWVSATSTDMDIYVTVRALDEKGQEVFYNSFNSQKSPVSVGFLKASHRKQDPERATSYRPFMTHLASDYQPLVPGEKTQLEVEIWPATAVLKAGYRLLLNIQPYDGCFAAAGGPNGVYLHEYDAAYHAGASNSVYTGGSEPSYLQIPVVPSRQ